MNKHIRVLAGAHAGACLDLTPGRWTVGPDPQASIRISDWVGDPLALLVDAEHGVLIESDDGGTAWDDLAPRRFGEIISAWAPPVKHGHPILPSWSACCCPLPKRPARTASPLRKPLLPMHPRTPGLAHAKAGWA
ncbi:hypothetical protein [Ralstonia sp. 1B3]|uniref:hypothetical protein n=1 Tax=Ralstonia sp. 1B3 TaxID=2997421 RepID=UPI002FC72AD0